MISRRHFVYYWLTCDDDAFIAGDERPSTHPFGARRKWTHSTGPECGPAKARGALARTERSRARVRPAKEEAEAEEGDEEDGEGKVTSEPSAEMMAGVIFFRLFSISCFPFWTEHRTDLLSECVRSSSAFSGPFSIGETRVGLKGE